MSIYDDLFGKKEEIEKKIFTSEIPESTRQTISYILSENCYHNIRSNFGRFDFNYDFQLWRYEICKEKGIKNINNISEDRNAISQYLLDCEIIDFLRAIEIYFSIRETYNVNDDYEITAKCVTDINQKLLIDKISYKLMPIKKGEIVRFRIIKREDNYLSNQVVDKAYKLVYDQQFKGAEDEFFEALIHYTKSEYKDTIFKCAKCFESIMKSILKNLNIPYKETDTAKSLLDICYTNDILPKSMENTANQLVILFSGLPTIRNKQSGHGQGIDIKNIDESYAKLTINLVGTYIVFLVDRYNELK